MRNEQIFRHSSLVELLTWVSPSSGPGLARSSVCFTFVNCGSGIQKFHPVFCSDGLVHHTAVEFGHVSFFSEMWWFFLGPCVFFFFADVHSFRFPRPSSLATHRHSGNHASFEFCSSLGEHVFGMKHVKDPSFSTKFLQSVFFCIPSCCLMLVLLL